MDALKRSRRFGLFFAHFLPPALLIFLTFIVVGFLLLGWRREAARDAFDFKAKQVASRAATVLAALTGEARLASANIAATLDGAADADAAAEKICRNLLDHDPRIFRAWFVFEADAFAEPRRLVGSFARGPDGIRRISDIGDELLDSSWESSRYAMPTLSGEPYFQVDGGRVPSGDDARKTGYYSSPVFIGGKPVGCLGVDFVYDQAFAFLEEWTRNDSLTLVLFAEDGTLLHRAGGSKGPVRDCASAGFAPEDMLAVADSLRLGRALETEMVSPFSGRASLMTLQPLPVGKTGKNICLYIDEPADTLARDTRLHMWILLAAGALSLAALTCLFLVMIRRHALTIDRIADVAGRVADGDLDTPLDGASDIGSEPLRHSLDKLALTTGRIVEQLRAARAHEAAVAEAEAEVRKIEETVRTKDAFFANMSHEIRTPMNAILGMSELLLAEPLADKQLKCVKDIKLAAEALLGIINDILDLSKLESGKLTLVNVDYDLSLVLENIASMGFFLAKEKNLKFVFEREESVPRCLFGDEIRLRQIILNIVGNAVKFTRKGSVTLRAADEGAFLRFDVADTGIGIKQEDIGGIFDAFRQLDAAKNRNIKGTGLGLSICRNLAEMMGGSIGIESVYGRGTTFRVRIPKIPGDASKIVRDEDAMRASFDPDAKILVVDDNQVNLKVAKGLIELLGVKCETAGSGAEALAMLGNARYALVFMDHMMPEMDGVETTKRIRALGGEAAKTPIVVLTANAVAGVQDLFLAAGMNDFLSKPIEKRKLQSILQKWMPKGDAAIAGKKEASSRRQTDQSAGTVSPHEADADMPASGTPAPGVLEAADGIEGLDVALGLSRVSNQHAIYEEILHLASETMPSLIEAIASSYADGDPNRLAVEVHGAKGSLASIGAMPLSKLAADLEQACRSNDMGYCAANIPPFLNGLEKLGEQLQDVFSVSTSPATMLYGSRTQLEGRLHKLLGALAHKDEKTIGRTVSSIVNRDFGPDVNGKVLKVKELIDAKEYADAIKHIKSFVYDIEVENDLSAT